MTSIRVLPTEFFVKGEQPMQLEGDVFAKEVN